MDLVGLQRGVVIVMNPQTGEILAMVSLPTYDDNLFAQGISNADYQTLLNDPNRPLLNFAISEQYPPGSTYKLVTGSGALQDGKITPTTPRRDRAVTSQIGPYKYWDWNQQRLRPAQHLRRLRPLQRHVLLPAGRRCWASTGSAYWAHQWGFGEQTGIDLPGEARGIVPDQRLEAERVFDQHDLPGRGLPGRHRPGLRRGHAAPAAQRLHRAGQRRHALPAADRAPRRSRPTAASSQDFQPEVIRQLDVDPDVLRTMRVAARDVRHQPAHLQPRGPADRRRRQVRHRRVRRPRQPGPPAVPLLVRGLRAQGHGTTGRAIRAEDRLAAGRPRLRLRLRTRRATRRPRSSSTSCSCTTTWASTCAGLTAPAGQLLWATDARDMTAGPLRLEPPCDGDARRAQRSAAASSPRPSPARGTRFDVQLALLRRSRWRSSAC